MLSLKLILTTFVLIPHKILVVIGIVLFYSIIGMIIDRNVLSKFLVGYESLFAYISFSILLSSSNMYELTFILLVLMNAVFEGVLGLSIFLNHVAMSFLNVTT